MRAVDTNVLVRLLTGEGGDQVEAAEKYVTGGAWISHVVLVEAIWVLKSVYRVPHSGLVRALEILLDHDTLVLQDPEGVSEALARYRQYPKLGFSDCLVLETARKTGHLPLGTFDQELARQAGAERIAAPP